MEILTPAAAAFHVVGLFTAGLGLIFFATDRHSRASRALALSFVVLGVRLLFAPLEIAQPSVALSAIARVLEALCILSAMEWARRIVDSVRRGLRRAANGLFLAAQILVVIYSGLSLGYLALDPADATTGAAGFFRVRAIEWAVFAPVLGTAILLSTIAILLLLFGRGDPAEAIRLRALMLSSPFLFAALLVQPAAVPVCITLGLLIFLFGAMRYLMVMSRRGQLMSQFLAPEVTKLMRTQGAEQVLRRERLALSAVFCDLRGFTAFTQARETQAVVSLLEQYYAAVGAAAAEVGATVKDHAGDGVLLLLGAPVAQKDHADRAVRLALLLRERLPPLLAPQGLGLGLGIASGEATVGAIQAAGRLEYVAVGPVINLASRLCQCAADGELLMDAETRRALPDAQSARFAQRPDETLKGIEGAVALYGLTAQ
ncbi:MAG: adenylate/guanylate cyclase domain-containing protein [Pseudomonadota bacterium]